MDKPKRRYRQSHSDGSLRLRAFFWFLVLTGDLVQIANRSVFAELAKVEMVMSTLREQLKREFEGQGEYSPVAQVLRNQIRAQNTGRGFQSLYLGKEPGTE